MSAQFSVLPSPAALAAAAADRVVASARNAIRRRGRCVLALSGGSTPRLVYPLLASSPRIDLVDWSRVDFFWGDERGVPADHPDSNFGLARRLLLDQLPEVRREAVHPMPADAAEPEAAAERYEATIGRVLGVRPGSTRRPRFDLVWLGMGPDGHTASLFPDAAALSERRRWVMPATAPKTSLVPSRMTVTLPLINAARTVLFVVAGTDKAGAVRAVRSGSSDLPAARVRARSTVWLLDAAAAGETARR
ncbi:MAG TPA: 6-phosphogluconolactonase [Candidatus Limnocylindria bacterium]|nr:6-phosphogluconolactonase [Candidatus Limnocylindria bacterium]